MGIIGWDDIGLPILSPRCRLDTGTACCTAERGHPGPHVMLEYASEPLHPEKAAAEREQVRERGGGEEWQSKQHFADTARTA